MSDRKNTELQSEMAVDEEAARWLVRMQCDSCSDRDIAEHKAWLDANLMHRKAYLRLESLWGELGEFSDRPEIIALRNRAKASSQADVVPLPVASDHERDTELEEGAASESGGSTGRRRFASALAASVLIAVISLLYLNQEGLQEASQGYVYQSAIGEQKTVQLSDGSELILDTQTRLAAYYSEHERRIVLEYGQARFQVAHDKTRPFVVSAGNGRITALGTAFVVRKNENEVLVTLLEGRVEVVQKEPLIVADSQTKLAQLPVQARELAVGQQLGYSDRGMTENELVDIDKVTAWQQGRLIYENQSLAEVIEDLNRYSKRQIVLGDDSLAQIRVNGVFKPGDDGRAIQALASYFSMRVENDASGNLVLVPEVR